MVQEDGNRACHSSVLSFNADEAALVDRTCLLLDRQLSMLCDTSAI